MESILGKKLLETDILIVVGLIEVTIAVLELSNIANVSPRIGTIFIYTFGTRSSISSYLFMFTVILVFALPFLLLHLRKESSQVVQNKQG